MQIYALLRVKFSSLKMSECKKMTNIRYGPLIHCHSDYLHNSTQFKQLGHFAFSLGQLMQLNLIYATQTPHILHFHSALSYIVIAVTRATQPNSSNSVHHFAFSLGHLTQLNLIYATQTKHILHFHSTYQPYSYNSTQLMHSNITS